MKINESKLKLQRNTLPKILTALLLALSFGCFQVSGQGICGDLSVPKEPLPVPNPFESSKEHEQSRMMLNSASVLIFGRSARPFELHNDWCRKLQSPSYANLPQCKNGLSLGEAATVLKTFLKDNINRQETIIKDAYLTVFGREPDNSEMLYWKTEIKAGKAWHIIIRQANIKYLKENEAEKTATVKRAYLAAFGREPVPIEYGYWKARNEFYFEILETHRKFLYSSGGKLWLEELKKRLKEKYPAATAENFKKFSEIWFAKRLIFEEMKFC